MRQFLPLGLKAGLLAVCYQMVDPPSLVFLSYIATHCTCRHLSGPSAWPLGVLGGKGEPGTNMKLMLLAEYSNTVEKSPEFYQIVKVVRLGLSWHRGTLSILVLCP